MATQVTTIDIHHQENEIYHVTVVTYTPNSPQKLSIEESSSVPLAIGAHENEVERPIYVYIGCKDLA